MLPGLQKYPATHSAYVNELEMLISYKHELILRSKFLLFGIIKNEFNRK